MSSRYVRFAPSFSSNDDSNYREEDAAANQQYGTAATDDTRRPSINSALEASMKATNFPHNRRASNSSSTGSNRRASTNVSDAQTISTAAFESRKVNTAIAANDGPSLAAALAQSIRHHARMIDGEQPSIKQQRVASRPAYDPYEDDDHVSLAPGVELNYERDAQSAPNNAVPSNNKQDAAPPALRDFVANAAAEDTDDGPKTGGGGGIDRTVEQQQERIDRLRDDSFGARFKTNISNWFGGFGADGGVGGGPDFSSRSRSVRFADDEDTVAVAAAIANTGRGVRDRGTRSEVRRASPRVVPHGDAAPFPSSMGEFDNVESRLNAPRRILAARKRHRRNDSFLRLMVDVLRVSLTFAIIYGEGRFGLAVTTMAYERKIAGRYVIIDSVDSEDQSFSEREEDIFYPEWWENEKGIPDMEAHRIKFGPVIEYNAADVTTPRAPDRIETPFFWFVPRSGGNAIRTIMSSCLRLAEASEYGHGSEQPFLIILEDEYKKFVNVDMTTSKGLKRAKDLKLASSAVPDVIISGDIHGVLDVFNNRNRARIFAVLRHPLDRAISKYYADLASDPEVGGMTLPQYVRSGGHRVENNYLTRYLSGRYGGKLDVRDLNLAREFLRRKFVVGLASDLPATANLFSHVFGWNNTAASLGLENVDLCYNNIYNALSDKSPPSVEEGSEGWKLLVAQNWFDLKIYEYAEHLFQVQVDQLKLTSSTKTEGAVERI
eukprot:CAMPEP_0181131212 /NCGR_PEP_ID=MMETSP1071-20121207/30302_1 /TAXON_ID=35127 /ORGANISM="Thalassiosira sp., Strain NH16" /LENGTH=718 /DNA_ID=CAMNT_0023217385 /DNA_START=124 /DNA_END=2282 /DNA_ORIENTATION=+